MTDKMTVVEKSEGLFVKELEKVIRKTEGTIIDLISPILHLQNPPDKTSAQKCMEYTIGKLLGLEEAQRMYFNYLQISKNSRQKSLRRDLNP